MMPTAAAATAEAESPPMAWIPGSTACQVLGTYHAKLVRLAKAGLIRRQQIGDGDPRYALADVLALRERSIQAPGGAA